MILSECSATRLAVILAVLTVLVVTFGALHHSNPHSCKYVLTREHGPTCMVVAP